MNRLLMFLLDGCWHKWNIIRETECTDDSGSTWTRFYCQCTKCGKPVKFD